MINLVNLLLRDTTHRVAILTKRPKEVDPELYIVTKIEWRDRHQEQPLLTQIPRLLSLLETLRGTEGVPTEIYLDSLDGIPVYLPTGLKLTDLPDESKKCVQFLIGLVEYTVVHRLQTMIEVEKWFWRRARRNGFSPKIVERMARNENHYDSKSLLERFNDIMQRYFSVRFKISLNEPLMRLENVG
jgi:hypothetical protein